MRSKQRKLRVESLEPRKMLSHQYGLLDPLVSYTMQPALAPVKNTAPYVTVQPTNQTVAAGATVSFTAQASGKPAPSVQWQSLAPGGTWTQVSGATSTTLSFTATADKSGDQYRAVFTNRYGSATTSAATLTVTSPVPIPPPPAPSGWSSQPLFLARPVSNVIKIIGQSGFTISNLSFANQVGEGVVSIDLENCSNFKIIGCDFSGDTEPIFCYNCTNFEIGWCRSLDIVGPSTRDGTHRGNFYQFDTCLSYHVHDILVKGGDTEDVFSNYRSGGTAANPSIIENFSIEGTNWSSTSSTGVILGDGWSSNSDGGYVIVRNFTMNSPGQVGVEVMHGMGYVVDQGTIYAAPRPGQTSPNVAVSIWEGDPQVTFSNLKVNWTKNDGTQNPYWFQYADNVTLTNDVWHATIDLTTLTVDL